MERKDLAEQNIRETVRRLGNTEDVACLVAEVFVYCSELVKVLHDSPRSRQMTIPEVAEVLDVQGADFFEQLMSQKNKEKR